MFFFLSLPPKAPIGTASDPRGHPEPAQPEASEPGQQRDRGSEPADRALGVPGDPHTLQEQGAYHLGRQYYRQY